MAPATTAGSKRLQHLSQPENSSRNSGLALPPELPAFLPAIIAAAGENASRRFLEFFTANIRNPNTRAAYARAVFAFCSWCERRRLALPHLQPIVIAAYIEQLGKTHSRPTVKQHLAAIRMLFDWLVIGHVLSVNPASAVRGPKHVVKKGKTPVLTGAEARQLLESIDTTTLVGLRDRALIGVMVYSFARVGAVTGMNIEDYYQQGKRWWFRLHEKGGKEHQVPVHHTAEEMLDSYLRAAQLDAQDPDERKMPLFRSMTRAKRLSDRRLNRREVLAMVKRRALKAALPYSICCHTFRATGITAYLENGGTIEKAQQIAAHESPRTTKLYDRTDDHLSLDEIERIVL
ncbi:MAG: tyrosine-type recombinase/integrase [Pirellulales bacterium]